MKHFKLSTLIVLLCASCNTSTHYKSDIILEHCSADKGIIVSCVKCSCVDTYLKDYLNVAVQDGGVVLYGDTNCVKGVSFAQLNYLSQAALDSVYELNYNLILYKRRKSSIDFRLIKTEESKDLNKIANRFFGLSKS